MVHAICYGTGGVQVKQSVDRWSRLAWAATMTAALMTAGFGLSACGRKGPLDPPPSAGIAPPPAYAPRPSLGEENYAPAPPPATSPARTAAAAPPAATEPPPKKTFFLDFLLAK
jgi:predicted small lipoprotein YifL